MLDEVPCEDKGALPGLEWVTMGDVGPLPRTLAEVWHDHVPAAAIPGIRPRASEGIDLTIEIDPSSPRHRSPRAKGLREFAEAPHRRFPSRGHRQP